MPILVTGGTGYIGSHTVNMLCKSGEDIIVLDNLVCGHKEAIPPKIKFYNGNINDKNILKKIFSKHDIESVIHFSAYAYVGESVINPQKYYLNNVCGTLNLLEIMMEYNCKRIVFSSTCAVYGIPEYLPLDETHKTNPINPYGRTKLMIETILEDYYNAYGLRYACLRYFNACGADTIESIGESHCPETHIIPLLLESAKNGKKIVLYGNDFNTKDGTCIRDYIHVIDLAKAHLLALTYIKNHEKITCNLGTGIGTSLKQLLQIIKKITNKDVNYEYGKKRIGDPPELFASYQLAKQKLNWQSDINIYDAINSAWIWMNNKRY